MKAPYMVGAYLDFLLWALGHDESVKAFEEATGHKLPPAPRNVLERMIDETTGIKGRYVAAFVVWATENLWGEEGVPDGWLNDMRAQAEGQKASEG